MRGKTFKLGMLCRLIFALILALCLIPVGQAPAVALSVDDYFIISYSAKFSKDEIQGSEVFYATVTGEATCIKDLPLSVSEAFITGRIIAEHKPSGTKVVLSSDYTLSISPFPNKEGEVTQASQSVALQFPPDSKPGSYNVVGELIEARVKAILWFTVTSFLPPYQSMGSVTYGQVATEPTPAGTTIIAGKINWQGIITETITAPSADSKCTVTLYEGTKALDKHGLPLQEISIVDTKESPALPENRQVIGLTYDIRPDGVTFEPPAVLALTYDASQIPEGVSQENLVIATWDEANGEWLELELFIVDPVTNTITAPVYHLTAFAVMAHTAPPAFTISELTIAPTEVKAGDSVTITALVTNTGDLPGSYELTLMINNEVVETRVITLPGGASELVAFNITEDTADFYLLNLNGLSGFFLVRESAAFTISELTIAPTEVKAGDSVTITALVTNTGDLPGSYELTLMINNEVVETRVITLPGGASELVAFNITEDTADFYLLNLNGLSGFFLVKGNAAPVVTPDQTATTSQTATPVPAPNEPTTNWWLVGGIYAANIALLIIILRLIRHKTGKSAI